MFPDPAGIFASPAVTITLSEEAWAAFITAIENPPKPNAELKKLFRDFPPSE
ncbi:DUF1778 domain-containing protein [bacterium]|nr:DUF1778 domain-containing protein [bacterium]